MTFYPDEDLELLPWVAEDVGILPWMSTANLLLHMSALPTLADANTDNPALLASSAPRPGCAPRMVIADSLLSSSVAAVRTSTGGVKKVTTRRHRGMRGGAVEHVLQHAVFNLQEDNAVLRSTLEEQTIECKILREMLSLQHHRQALW